jgi:uncharacterized protein YwgA
MVIVKVSLPWHRLGLIATVAEKSPKGWIGRTGLMKLAYFLQTLRDVPLEYHFTLYSYGPYDTDVLDDLDYASSLGTVQVETKQYPNGNYGYEIAPGPHADRAKEAASEFLSKYSGDIDWVMALFGNLNVPELELASTLIYVDREAFRTGKKLDMKTLVKRVRDVKPHFSDQEISERAAFLQERELLKSVQ